MTTENSFVTLSAINVNDKIEKKNGLSYLSWAWAVDQLFRADANAYWEYGPPTTFGSDTMMVHCTVTAFGKARTAHLPVMDYKNKAIPLPNAFEVNTAMQRCLVKAIALHGLGLYIYAGEDIPSEGNTVADSGNGKAKVANPLSEMKEDAFDALPEEQKKFLRELAADVTALTDEGRNAEAYGLIEHNHLEMEEKLGLWHLLGSKARTAVKKAGDEARMVAKAEKKATHQPARA